MMLINQYMDRKDGFVYIICTGSLFLAALGQPKMRRVTSHWDALPMSSVRNSLGV